MVRSRDGRCDRLKQLILTDAFMIVHRASVDDQLQMALAEMAAEVNAEDWAAVDASAEGLAEYPYVQSTPSSTIYTQHDDEDVEQGHQDVASLLIASARASSSAVDAT